MKRFRSALLAALGTLLAASVFAFIVVRPVVRIPPTVPAPMPRQWTQFRLNPQNNPVIAFNGAPSWSVETHGPFSSSPAVVDGTLYLGNNRGGVYAVDVKTGQVKWSAYFRNPIMSNPLVYDHLVIIGEGNANSTTYVPRRQVQVGNGPNALIALDEATGKIVWRVPLAGTGMPTPVIVDGLLLHHNGSGGIIAVDPKTGRVVYRKVVKSIASMVGLLPLRDGLVVSTGLFPNRIFAFRAATGRTVWTYNLPDNDSGVGDCPPVTDGKRVFGDYIAPPQRNMEAGVGVPGVERVYALDAKTGALLWDVGLETAVVPPRNESAIPLVARGRLFLGSAIAPYVHAIDPATGKVLWTVKVGGPVLGGIVEKDGRIFFGDLAGNLWAVNATTGDVVGKLKTQTPFNVGSPVIVGDSLIIGSQTGSISAIPLDQIVGSPVASR
jgi:outer membrane protein assembly factor BamB